MKRKISLFMALITVLMCVTIMFTGCTPKVESISLSETTLSLKPGETKNVTYTILPSKAADTEVTWSSSNNSVATVSGGKITAKAEGECKITVRAGEKSASVKVTVILTPEMLIAEGKYLEAYKKAPATQKNMILAENVIGYICDEIDTELEGLYDITSIKKGYYRAFYNTKTSAYVELVTVYVSLESVTDGNTYTWYFSYGYNHEDNVWDFNSLSDTLLSEDGDDWEDEMDKMWLNLAIHKDSFVLGTEELARLNTHIEKNTLSNFNLFPEANVDKTLWPTA